MTKKQSVFDYLNNQNQTIRKDEQKNCLFPHIPRNPIADKYQQDLENEIERLQEEAKARAEVMSRDNAKRVNEYLKVES